MRLFVLLFALFALSFASRRLVRHKDDACGIFHTDDGYYTYDIRPLMRTGGEDIQCVGGHAGQEYLFTMNVCAPVLVQGGRDECKTAAVCQHANVEGGNFYSLGDVSQVNLRTSELGEDQGVIMDALGGKPYAGEARIYRHSMISLQCKPGVDYEMHFDAEKEKIGLYEFTVKTRFACPSTPRLPQGSGNAGWVFLLFVFIGTVIYVVAGTIYKMQKMGATGLESLPNIDFWREFPSYVKEGGNYLFANVAGICRPQATGYTEV